MQPTNNQKKRQCVCSQQRGRRFSMRALRVTIVSHWSADVCCTPTHSGYFQPPPNPKYIGDVLHLKISRDYFRHVCCRLFLILAIKTERCRYIHMCARDFGSLFSRVAFRSSTWYGFHSSKTRIPGQQCGPRLDGLHVC